MIKGKKYQKLIKSTLTKIVSVFLGIEEPTLLGSVPSHYYTAGERWLLRPLAIDNYLQSQPFFSTTLYSNLQHALTRTNATVVYIIMSYRCQSKRSIWKMLGPFTTVSRRTPHYHSPGVATVTSHAAWASMSTTTTTTTTKTTRDRGDRYGPMEWAQ